MIWFEKKKQSEKPLDCALKNNVTFPSFWCWSKAAMSSVAHWTLSGLGENSSCTARICPGWITCLPSHKKRKHFNNNKHSQCLNTFHARSWNWAAFTSSRLCINESDTHANKTQIKTPLKICSEPCGRKHFYLTNGRNVGNTASAKQRQDMRRLKMAKTCKVKLVYQRVWQRRKETEEFVHHHRHQLPEKRLTFIYL